VVGVGGRAGVQYCALCSGGITARLLRISSVARTAWSAIIFHGTYPRKKDL